MLLLAVWFCCVLNYIIFSPNKIYYLFAIYTNMCYKLHLINMYNCLVNFPPN